MLKTKIIILLSSLLLITVFTPKAQASNLCSYQGITTTDNIRNQMSYPDEKFIGIAISSLSQISNLSQLKGLTCLEYLDFYKSDIKGNLSNLKNLENLVVFNMNNNPGIFGDVCALSRAKNLRALRLAFNPEVTGNISCLKNLNLDVFAVTGTQISGNLSDFSHMTNLKELYLGGTKVEGDVASLSKLTDFTELVISDNQEQRPKIYGDLSTLKNFKSLKRVALYNINATNCEQFTKDHPDIPEGGCSQLSGSSTGSFTRQTPQKNVFLNAILVTGGIFFTGLILVIFFKKRKIK